MSVCMYIITHNNLFSDGISKRTVFIIGYETWL